MLPNYVLLALMAMPAAAYPPNQTGASVALVGDSITAFGSGQAALTGGMTLTSDGAGNITGTVANSIYGNAEVYFNNLANPAYELYGRNTYAAGSISVATGTSLAAGTTTANATKAAMNLWNQFSGRGVFTNVLSLFQGGLEFGGNYGHGGMTAANMGPQMAYALSRSPSLVLLMAGTNDINGGVVTATTVMTSIKALMDQCRTANVPVVVCAVTPVGTAFGASYATTNGTGTYGIQTLNALIKAECLTTPTQTVYADTFTPMYDATNQCGYANYLLTSDGLHPTTAGAIAMAPAVYAAMSPWVSAPVLLPTSAADTGAVHGHTKFIIKGPWVTTNGGTLGTGVTASTGASGTAGTLNYTPPGGTGGLPSTWQGLRLIGTPTATCSIFDPGDGKGMKVQTIVQPGAANDLLSIAPIQNITLASLGLVQGDEIAIACEVDWSNATASGLGAVQMTVTSPSGGAYGYSTTMQQSEATGIIPDSMTGRVLMTGWLKINNASFTQLQAYIGIKFASAGASPAVVNVRRFTVFKR